MASLYPPRGAFDTKVKIYARVGRFDKRLRDDMFIAVIYVDIYKIVFLVESHFCGEF